MQYDVVTDFYDKKLGLAWPSILLTDLALMAIVPWSTEAKIPERFGYRGNTACTVQTTLDKTHPGQHVNRHFLGELLQLIKLREGRIDNRMIGLKSTGNDLAPVSYQPNTYNEYIE